MIVAGSTCIGLIYFLLEVDNFELPLRNFERHLLLQILVDNPLANRDK